MYDNNEYLNVSYPTDLTPDQQLEFVTDTAKVFSPDLQSEPDCWTPIYFNTLN